MFSYKIKMLPVSTKNDRKLVLKKTEVSQNDLTVHYM